MYWCWYKMCPDSRTSLLQLTDVANCFWVAPPRPHRTSPGRFNSASARHKPDSGHADVIFLSCEASFRNVNLCPKSVASFRKASRGSHRRPSLRRRPQGCWEWWAKIESLSWTLSHLITGVFRLHCVLGALLHHEPGAGGVWPVLRTPCFPG